MIQSGFSLVILITFDFFILISLYIYKKRSINDFHTSINTFLILCILEIHKKYASLFHVFKLMAAVFVHV